MSPTSTHRAHALALAATLVGWSFTAGPQRPRRRHPLVQAALGTALALTAGAPLGLRPPQLRSGLRLGGAAAGVVAATVAASTALPRVRSAMSERELPDRVGRWLALEIPLGTVWSEETAFRGALAVASSVAFGTAGGRLVQAIAFGLSHIPDARATGESVVGTVALTGLAGWLFGWLAQRSGSLAAPMLAHLAINEAGALAALVTQRRSGGGTLASAADRHQTANR